MEGVADRLKTNPSTRKITIAVRVFCTTSSCDTGTAKGKQTYFDAYARRPQLGDVLFVQRRETCDSVISNLGRVCQFVNFCL